MRFLARWIWRGVLALVLVALLLIAPVGYIELACQGEAADDRYQPLITDPAWQRAESKTLMTYPEWHIVHAYDDYAKVISAGDPHDFQFLRAIAGFWTSLCPLSEQSAQMGGIPVDTKKTIYTIGVSFSAELLAKAAYEETVGRLVTLVRGEMHRPLDKLSAKQAAKYAQFLQQTPWYKWDFEGDRRALQAYKADSFRDNERQLALGMEYRAKAAYAGVIAKAVEGMGADELRIRSVIAGLSGDELRAVEGVDVIEPRGDGVLIETDRYRVFTGILQALAYVGGGMVEIAGNDTILFTATSDEAAAEGALYSFQRQGYGDWRHLIVVPVSELASRLRALGGLRLEHVHDY